MSAYLTGVAVTSAPVAADDGRADEPAHRSAHRRLADFALVERIVTLVYALTVVLSAPLHIVLSRYAADRLYDQRLDSDRRAAVAGAGERRCSGSLVIGVVLMSVLHVPLALRHSPACS